jgi:Spy/CpxP family protein refolding chaperone
MQRQCWKSGWMTVLVVTGIAAMSLAQDAPVRNAAKSGKGAYGFVSTLERKVGLTPEQRDSVRGLLAEQRQKSQALREETDHKIRAILNPEQQQKFDEVLAEQKSRFSRKNQGA